MDVDLIKKYNLGEQIKRFQQINEYTFITSPMISEDGEDDEQQNMPPQDNQMGGDNGQAPQPPMGQDAQGGGMGNDSNQPMNMPQNPQDGGAMPMNDPQNPQDGGAMPMDNGQQGGAMMDDMGGNAAPMGFDDNGESEEQQEGDTVIDVDDLTQSQEASEIKIDGVDDKLTRILSVINKFGSALLANDRKIDNLRQEFEKRNPSEQEMLNIRSQASYPYSETPKDYWENKKAQNPHYNIIYDNDVSTSDEQKQFKIKRDDVRDINVNEIGKSFDINDFKLDDFIKF